MRLTHIRIKNLRCIEEQSLDIQNLTSLIGPNNAGKSTVLRAVELFLGMEQPIAEEWRRLERDEVAELEMVIECHFDNIQDWERRKPAISKIVHDDKIILRRKIRLGEEGSAQAIKKQYEAYVPMVTIKGWSDKEATLSAELKKLLKDKYKMKYSEAKANWVDFVERVRSEDSDFIESDKMDWSQSHISFDQALKQGLPNVEKIPAVRDATDEGKMTAKNPLGILMTRVIIPAVRDTDEHRGFDASLQSLLAKVRSGDLQAVRDLEDDISDKISEIVEARVKFAFDPPDVTKLLSSHATIKLDDGVETPIALKGHGAQRSLIVALIEYLAERNARDEETEQVKSTIILFEEPELYMHPHIMRRLRIALEKISQRPEWQVILSTHSPFMIDVVTEPRSLVIMRREHHGEAPRIVQLQDDPFASVSISDREAERTALRAALDFHPSVNEVFFARRAVLVEGDTEMAILKHRPDLIKHCEVDADKADHVTVVSCGGKWTIPAIARLLNLFQIEYRVVHDRDKKGRSDGELETAAPLDPYKANEKIQGIAGSDRLHVVDDTVEDVLWPGEERRSSKEKPFRAWKRVGELTEEPDGIDALPKLKELVQFVYNW